jgi:hypothetical protein
VRVRGYAWLLAVLCLAAATTACTGDSDKPSTLPSGASSATASAPSGSASESPSDLASSTVVHLWSSIDAYSQAKTDGHAVTDLYLPSCSRCRLIMGDIQAIRNQGQHVEGGVHTVRIGSAAAASPSLVRVQATVQAAAGRVVDGNGKTIRTASGTPAYTWLFDVSVSGTTARVLSANNLGV